MTPRNFYTSRNRHSLYQKGCWGHPDKKLDIIPPGDIFYLVEKSNTGLFLVIYKDMVGVFQSLQSGDMQLFVEPE